MSLHISWRIPVPLQFLPPHEGLGLEHSLVKFCIPPPQLLLQGPGIHELHSPLTMQYIYNITSMLLLMVTLWEVIVNTE